MITLNTFIKRFEDFANNHYFIRQFSFGAPEDVDLSKDGQYPLMHIIYTGASYDETTKTLDFEVYILDLPSHYDDKTERQKEVVSDAEQCAEDIIADIANGHNVFIEDENYEVTNAAITPLAEEGSNVLAGVLLDLSIQIPYDRSACDAPINGVLPEGGGFVYQRRGLLRVLTQDGSVDVASVNTIRVTNGTLVNEGGGIVSIDTGGVDELANLIDVRIEEPLDRESLVYDEASAKWINGGAAKLDFSVFNPGAAIPVGKVVRFNGAVQGDRPCIVLAAASAALDVRTIVGVTSERIEANSPGHVRPYGTIYGIDTSIAPVGTIVYLSVTAGEWTPLVTTAPVPRIPVAVITRQHANTGRLFVRNWSPNYKLSEIADVGFPFTLALNDVLSWDGTKWTNRAINTGTIPAPPGQSPPPGGFKSVWFQDFGGGFTYDTAFTYTLATSTLAVSKITATQINGRTLATDAAKLDGIQAGAEVNVNADWNAVSGDAQILNKPTFVASVAGTSPIVSTGGTTPTISIDAATTSTAGSLSAADKLKLDGIAAGAAVASVTGTSPIVSSGGTTPAISITDATTSAAGAMSASDKTKLDGIAAGAEVNVNADWNAVSGDALILNKPTIPNTFGTIAVAGQSNVVADSTTDTLTLVAGSNVTITTNATTDTITIAASGGGGGSSYSVVRQQSGTSYTLQLTDAGAYIQTTSTTAVTITIPLQSSVTWAADTEIYFEQNNTGQITIAGASGVTINSSETLKTFARYSVIAAKRVAENVWTLTGERALV